MFSFPEDAAWDAVEEAVAFTLVLGEYEGKVLVPRRVFHDLIGNRPSPEECLSRFHLNRALFERAAEARVHARALDDDAAIRLTGRDLRAVRGG
jgi:hypothetical protein